MDIDIRIYNKNGFKNIKGENIFCEVPNCHNNSVYRIPIVYDFKEYYLCDKHYTNYHNFMVTASARMAKEQKIAMNKVINGKDYSIFSIEEANNKIEKTFF